MECRWIKDIEEFRDMASQWDRAVLASKEDSPFLLSCFLLTWWKHYSGDLKLRIFTLFQDGEIVGGLPLCQDKRGYLEYPGRITANYTEIVSITDRQIFWQYFFESLRHTKEWRRIKLKRFRKNRLDIDKLNQAAFVYTDILLDVYNSDDAYLIDIPKDFSEFIKQLPKKLRYYVKRSENEFSKLGAVSLNSLKDRNEVNKLSEKYIAFSRYSFRGRNKRSAFEDDTYCAFFKELMTRFCEAGYLDANALKLNDRIIAIHFGYSIGDNLNYIFPAFDIDFARLNPGHLLIYKLLELGSKRRNKLFDLYTGSHLYKEQWSTRREEVVCVEIRPNCIRSKIERNIFRELRESFIVSKMKVIVNSSPMLADFAGKIKTMIRGYI